MSSRNRSEIKKLKRERIIESATELFSRMKFHEVMMDEVAKLTLVAKGTLYNYFESKEELYSAVLKFRLEKLLESLNDKIGNETNSIESLRSFVVHLYTFMMKNRSFFKIYFQEYIKTENGFHKEIRSLDDDLILLLKSIILKGRKELLFNDLDEDLAVELILGSIYGSVRKGIENEYSEDEMLYDREKIFYFVLHGILAGYDDFKMHPLKDKTLVITRTLDQSKESLELFSRFGAKIIIFPTLQIIPPSDWKYFDDVITSEKEIDFIIFTSAHAVKMFSKRCKELNVTPGYENLKVVAVGNKTASACSKEKIPVDITPEVFSGEGVVKALSVFNLKKKLILIPRSEIGREELPTELGKLGAVTKAVPVYNVTVPSKDEVKNHLERLINSKPDLFIFTSPSTFENFVSILGITIPSKYFIDFDIAAIGPTTKSAIEARGVKVDIMPPEFTMDGLVNAVIKYYNR
ncbi:MAG: uroporphyrinogen-III synthase [Ignavibacteriales bacterium]|nr:MAG: uroporphyrinogen-III synthase [Ignavibacteriales bacterium]